MAVKIKYKNAEVASLDNNQRAILQTEDSYLEENVIVEATGFEPKLQAGNFDKNGSYQPDSGYDGFDSVVVNVPISECSGNHTIEVTELPTENIDENAMYKCGERYYKRGKKFADILISDGEGNAQSFVEIAQAEGVGMYLHYVPTRPTENIKESYEDDILILNFYYIEDENEVLAYGIVDYETGERSWVNLFETDELSFIGAVNDASQVTELGYYALIDSEWYAYNHTDGEKNITENGTYDVTHDESVTVDVPNAILYGKWKFNERAPDDYADYLYELYDDGYTNRKFKLTADFTVDVDGETDSFKAFRVLFSSSGEARLEYMRATSERQAYDLGTWVHEDLRTIDFGAVPVIVSTEDKQFMETYATFLGESAGGECSGSHVIEVDELPAEDINENAVYLCGGNFYTYDDFLEFRDALYYINGELTNLAALGITTSLNVIPNKQAEGIKASYVGENAAVFHFYYIEEDEGVFVFMGGTWVSASDMLGEEYGGIVSEPPESVPDGQKAYFLIVEGKRWTCYSTTGLVEVDELPTENIDERAVYAYNGGESTLRDMAVVDDGLAMWYASLAVANGIPINFSTVDVLPETPVLNTVYYVKSLNALYMYDSDGLAPVPDFQGIVSSRDEVGLSSPDGYYALIEPQRQLCIYKRADRGIKELYFSFLGMILPVSALAPGAFSYYTVDELPPEDQLDTSGLYYVVPANQVWMYSDDDKTWHNEIPVLTSIEDYAGGQVFVVASDGWSRYIIPQGMLGVTKNGFYDIKDKSMVLVKIPDDALCEKWQFNETMSFSPSGNYGSDSIEIDFTVIVDGVETSFKKIEAHNEDIDLRIRYYKEDGTYIEAFSGFYYNNNWKSEDLRTVNFGVMPQMIMADVAGWVRKNAVRINETVEEYDGTITIE